MPMRAVPQGKLEPAADRHAVQSQRRRQAGQRDKRRAVAGAELEVSRRSWCRLRQAVTWPRKSSDTSPASNDGKRRQPFGRNARRLDQNAAGAVGRRAGVAVRAAAARRPWHRRRNSTVAVMSASPLRQPSSPPSKRALSLTAAPLGLAVDQRGRPMWQCGRRTSSIRRGAEGTIACARSSVGRKRPGMPSSSTSGATPAAVSAMARPRRLPLGRDAHVVDPAFELQAVAVVARQPQLQLTQMAALQLHGGGDVAIGACRP